MPKTCAITQKTSQTGGKYSNRVRATQFNPTGRVRRAVNLVKRRIFVPELNKYFTLNLSTKGIRTLNKNGAYQTLKKAGVI